MHNQQRELISATFTKQLWNNKGIYLALEDVIRTQQQRPESPTLARHASKYKVHLRHHTFERVREDVALVELMYLVFTCISGSSGFCCACDVFRALSKSL